MNRKNWRRTQQKDLCGGGEKKQEHQYNTFTKLKDDVEQNSWWFEFDCHLQQHSFQGHRVNTLKPLQKQIKNLTQSIWQCHLNNHEPDTKQFTITKLQINWLSVSKSHRAQEHRTRVHTASTEQKPLPKTITYKPDTNTSPNIRILQLASLTMLHLYERQSLTKPSTCCRPFKLC